MVFSSLPSGSSSLRRAAARLTRRPLGASIIPKILALSSSEQGILRGSAGSPYCGVSARLAGRSIGDATEEGASRTTRLIRRPLSASIIPNLLALSSL